VSGETINVVLLVALGLSVATYGSIIGAGGGFLLVPALLLLQPGETARTVTTMSLAAIAVNGLSATTAYARLGRIDVRSGILLAASAIPGAILGAWAVRFVSRGLFDVAFGLLLVAIAAYLVYPHRSAGTLAPPQLGWVERRFTDANGTIYFYAFSRRLAFLIGFADGLIAALAGIGGGILVVPAIVAWLHFPVHIATATSAFVFTISALTGTATHVLSGDFDFALSPVVFLAIGVLAGAQIGARLSGRLSQGLIIRLLAIGIGLIGFGLIFANV
jgi:uncharacterized membrane protein YfcA